MDGYIKRNSSGVKEIRAGNVIPPWSTSSYRVRHTMSQYDWGKWWETKIAWESAKIVHVHPGTYWAFPEEGPIEYIIYSNCAVPTGFPTDLLKENKVNALHAHKKFERFLYPEDGGYRARRNAEDRGL